MKTTLIASALLVLSVTASGSAFAQRNDYGHGNNYNNGRAQQNNDRHDNARYDNVRYEKIRHVERRGGNNQYRIDNTPQYHRDGIRSGGSRHDLRRGQHLSEEYRDNRYNVND